MSTTNPVFPCAICLETASEPVATRCGHLFCWGCLDQWLNSGRSTCDCPVCKGRVDPKIPGDIIPLYGVGRSEGNNDPSAAGEAERPEAHNQQPEQPQPRRQPQQHAFHRRPTPQDVPGPRRQNSPFISLGTSGFASSFLFFGTDMYSLVLFGLFFLLYQLGIPWLRREIYPRLQERWRRWRAGGSTSSPQPDSYRREEGEGSNSTTTSVIPSTMLRYINCVLAVVIVSFIVSLLVM